jgi:TPR repeat protein
LLGRGVTENPVMAAKRWESAANHGDHDGANYFGICLEFGRGVEIAVDRAAKYYRQAADSGHADVQCHFGFCLEHGLGFLSIFVNLQSIIGFRLIRVTSIACEVMVDSSITVLVSIKTSRLL